jgi:hypothetical protein
MTLTTNAAPLRRSIVMPAVVWIAHVHAVEPPAERRKDTTPTIAAVGIVRIEPETPMDEAAMKEGAIKHEPAVNADYAVANSEPASAERSSGAKSAPPPT